uniref:Uncharacterized protein n=1 Tax=Staphylococcus aureus TaxID=1280 RepID=D2JDI3_STAAU|nr:hypothetical protein SAP043A_045 [Staphylococcus aureus]
MYVINPELPEPYKYETDYRKNLKNYLIAIFLKEEIKSNGLHLRRYLSSTSY